MVKKVARLALFLVFFSFLISFFPTPVLAQGPQPWADGVCVQVVGSEEHRVATIQGASCAIANILSFAVTGLGLIAFAMFIFASFKYMLAGNQTKSTESARSTMTFAIVGIVVALSAFIILNLLVGFTGIESLLDFVIPGSDTNVP